MSSEHILAALQLQWHRCILPHPFDDSLDFEHFVPQHATPFEDSFGIPIQIFLGITKIDVTTGEHEGGNSGLSTLSPNETEKEEDQPDSFSG
jgi:hypothetical protein